MAPDDFDVLEDFVTPDALNRGYARDCRIANLYLRLTQGVAGSWYILRLSYSFD